MLSNVLSFTGHPCGFRRIALIADISSCISPRVRVLAMSTTRDGETTSITLSNVQTFSDRLLAAHHRALETISKSNNDRRSRYLADCQNFFGYWYKDHFGPDGRIFRERAMRDEAQAVSIGGVVDEANDLMQHCEFALGLPQRNPRPTIPITQYVRFCSTSCVRAMSVEMDANIDHSDEYRDDCFEKLANIFCKQPQSKAHFNSLALTAALIGSNQNSHSQNTPSPRIANSASPAARSSSRASPASYDGRSTYNESPIYVKQEPYTDELMEDLQDRAHLRKDSQQTVQSVKDQMQDRLPPLYALHGNANLAEVPVSKPYSQAMFPQSTVLPSPSSNSASSPQTPYASSSLLNGHDQQTVMMSPSVLHPPLSVGPGAASFLPAMFHDSSRPTSQQSPSSPEQ